MKVCAHLQVRNAIPFKSFILANIFSILCRFLYVFLSWLILFFALDFAGIQHFNLRLLRAERTSPDPYALSAICPAILFRAIRSGASFTSWTSPTCDHKIYRQTIFDAQKMDLRGYSSSASSNIPVIITAGHAGGCAVCFAECGINHDKTFFINAFCEDTKDFSKIPTLLHRLNLE